MNKQNILWVALAGFALGMIYLTFSSGSQFGAAPGGFLATTASTSRLVVGTSAGQLIASSTCVARVVTTEEAAIKFTVGDETPVSNGLGHTQAASTTVTYDSATYGCGSWRGISATGAATNVTLTEYLSFR